MSYYVCLNESKKFSTKLKRKWRRRKERGEEAAEQVKPFVNLSEEEKKNKLFFHFLLKIQILWMKSSGPEDNLEKKCLALKIKK